MTFRRVDFPQSRPSSSSWPPRWEASVPCVSTPTILPAYLSLCNGRTRCRHVDHPHLLKRILRVLDILLGAQNGAEGKLGPRDTCWGLDRLIWDRGRGNDSYSGSQGCNCSNSVETAVWCLVILSCNSAPGTWGARLKDGLWAIPSPSLAGSDEGYVRLLPFLAALFHWEMKTLWSPLLFSSSRPRMPPHACCYLFICIYLFTYLFGFWWHWDWTTASCMLSNYSITELHHFLSLFFNFLFWNMGWPSYPGWPWTHSNSSVSCLRLLSSWGV